MASIEQDLMVMLQHLPIPITITWQSNRYHWQCVDGHGSSNDLVEASRQSLNYLILTLYNFLRKGQQSAPVVR